MALSVKVGTFSTNTGTGNQSVSGLGFQPIAVIFFSTRQTADDGSSSSFVYTLGAGTSSSDRWAESAYSEHNLTQPDANSRRESRVIVVQTLTGGNSLVADLVSLDADGFTINITTASGTAIRIGYIALGGTEITNAKAGTVTQTTGTGNQSFTGVGFQPTLLLLVKGSNATGNANTGNANLSFGWAKSSTVRASVGSASRIRFIAGNSNTSSILRSDRVCSFIEAIGDSLIDADLVSMDSDGFTINKNTTTGGNATISYLALAGTFQSAIGVDTQKTTTGTKATTGVGFTPKLVFLGSGNKVSSSSVSADNFMSLGGGDGTNEACMAGSDHDNLATSQAGGSYTNAKVIRHVTTGSGGSPTITTVAEADLSALGADGFTLDWTTADGTAREFFYLALGDSAVVVPDRTLPHYRKSTLPDSLSWGGPVQDAITWRLG